MEEIQEKLIKYLKDKNIYEETDFKKSNHDNIYFSINKLKELIKVDLKINASKIKEFGSNEYILMSDVSNYIKNINDVRQYWITDIHEIFKLTKIFKTNGLEIINDIENIGYSGQFMFTYTLSKFLKQNYKNMTLSIEENFLKRLDINIIINKNRGPRVDIVIDQAKIIIEYDEIQHFSYEHIEKDEIRDSIIKAYGYEIIRFKESSNLINFFVNIKSIIKEQELLENPTIYGKYIIDFFVEKGYREDVIEKLTSEIIIDIINDIPFEDIGKTPRNLKLNKDIFDWLFINSKISKKKITELLINTIDEPYNESEDSSDYILSPDAFEELLSYIDTNEYPAVIPIRKAYIDIKKKLLEYVYKHIIKLKKLMDTRTKLLKYVSNEGYLRGEKDAYIKYKDLEKKNNELKNENDILQNIIDNSIPKNKRGFIKKNIITVEKELKIKQPIVEYIPELLYTGSSDDYVDEHQIKILFEQNKKKLKINITYTECIKIIKKKLNYVNNSNSLINKFIFFCKIEYCELIEKTINNIVDKDEDDNDEF